MKVLYCSWYENSQEDLENALNKITDEVIVIEHKVREYLGIDESVRQEIISIVENGIDMIISFDFSQLYHKYVKAIILNMCRGCLIGRIIHCFIKRHIINVTEYFYLREMALNYYRNIILIMYIIQVSQLI